MSTTVSRVINSRCQVESMLPSGLLPYTVSKAACQIIHSVHLCSLLPLCHTPLSPTVILSNSLLISSQPSFYLLPLFSSVSVTNIFHFLKVIRRSQLTGVVKVGEGRPSSVSLSLPLLASKKNYSTKTGSSIMTP